MKQYPKWYELENICHIENSRESFGNYPSDFIKKMLVVAIRENRQKFLKMLFSYYNVPDTLSLEEKISYYHLLGDNFVK